MAEQALGLLGCLSAGKARVSGCSCPLLAGAELRCSHTASSCTNALGDDSCLNACGLAAQFYTIWGVFF